MPRSGRLSTSLQAQMDTIRPLLLTQKETRPDEAKHTSKHKRSDVVQAGRVQSLASWPEGGSLIVDKIRVRELSYQDLNLAVGPRLRVP